MRKQTHRGGQPPTDIQISEHTIGWNEMAMMATLVVTIVLSVAVWKVATGVMWALIVLSAGQSAYLTLLGAGHFVRMWKEGNAQIERAKRGMRLEIHPTRQITGPITREIDTR